MASIERRNGPTPNGGVASEIYYTNDEGELVDKEYATRAEIVELDAQGNRINSTYLEVDPFDEDERRVWEEGRNAYLTGQPPDTLPQDYREDWRAVFWSMGYSEAEDDSL